MVSFAAAFCAVGALTLDSRAGQDSQQKPPEKAVENAPDKPQEKPAPKLPAQIDLLETSVRFEANGDSRKEVHAVVKINSELGTRQFARLSFNYNRSFESVEIPLAHITHAHGGTSDALPSAISDNPDPAVVNAPAYQDVRVKSIRILGLEPDDTLEYRVVTKTFHHPLAPDIWLEHTFERAGLVSQESFELDLPASRLADSPNLRRVALEINAETPAETRESADSDGSTRRIYRWHLTNFSSSETHNGKTNAGEYQKPDIEMSSFIVWGVFVEKLGGMLRDRGRADSSVAQKATRLTQTHTKPREKLEALYDFVSQKIATVDLPVSATGFQTRTPAETVSSGYATPLDKFLLFAALASSLKMELEPGLVRIEPELPKQLPIPSLFTHILTMWGTGLWLDPSLEVAPFGLITPALHGKEALWVQKLPDCGPTADCGVTLWATVPSDPPFASFQKVHVDATLSPEGALAANVKYTLRGENELLLRVAFHQTPKEKWKGVAQLLSISDGFRGQITNATASDPYETQNPFRVEYEITQPKFADWSKKSVRLPALLPLLGLPEPAAKPAAGAKSSPIQLGTPLDVEVTMTLHLPDGSGSEVPAGTSVERDFATYSSQYAVNGTTLTASRHINFIRKEISADRAAEYNAFLHTVQNDESQVFTVQNADNTAPNPQKPKQ